MIITQTPLRISFFGGGTDFRDYYMKNGGGAVLSTAIDKYVFVIIKQRFDEKMCTDLWLNLKIVLKTVWVFFVKDGNV